MAARPMVANLANNASRICFSPVRPVFRTVALSKCSQRAAASSRFFSIRPSLLAKRYTHDHEWIELDSDGTTGTIGISEYAAKALGDVVYVELPTVEEEFSQGDTIGAVESVKSASDIMTPVAGQIIEANAKLEETPATINKSPEGDGWIVKIKVTNTNELDSLMDATAYKAYTEE